MKNALVIFALLLCGSVSAEPVIPGVPGVDYSTYKSNDEIPATSFDCKQQNFPGYYGDPETRYQTFWICQADGTADRHLCPVGTMFDNQYFVCNWWYEVNN